MEWTDQHKAAWLCIVVALIFAIFAARSASASDRSEPGGDQIRAFLLLVILLLAGTLVLLEATKLGVIA